MHVTTERLLVLAVVSVLVSAIVGGLIGAGLASDPDAGRERPEGAKAGCDVAEVSSVVLRSLVTIHVRGPAGSGNGSGSVLDRQGNILTNDHVIAPAARGGTVTVDPTIGVLAVTVTEEMAAATGLVRGARVEQVLPGLGAAAAGLQPGDVITKIGDAAVNGVDQMLVAIRGHNPGEAVPVTYARGGAVRTDRVAVSAA